MSVKQRAIALMLLLSVTAFAANDPTVYRTKTGEKYHTEWCRYLSKSKIPIKLSEAKRRYSPCSVCKPPTIAEPR